MADKSQKITSSKAFLKMIEKNWDKRNEHLKWLITYHFLNGGFDNIRNVNDGNIFHWHKDAILHSTNPYPKNHKPHTENPLLLLKKWEKIPIEMIKDMKSQNSWAYRWYSPLRYILRNDSYTRAQRYSTVGSRANRRDKERRNRENRRAEKQKQKQKT